MAPIDIVIDIIKQYKECSEEAYKNADDVFIAIPINFCNEFN